MFGSLVRRVLGLGVPPISIGFNQCPASSVFNTAQLIVNGNLLSCSFDDEGYWNRFVDLLFHWQLISRE